MLVILKNIIAVDEYWLTNCTNNIHERRDQITTNSANELNVYSPRNKLCGAKRHRPIG
jgi:hypothetical protein